MKENFPNLVKEIDIHIQEVQGVPKELDPKLTTPRHIGSKLPKVKGEENLKSSKRKAETYLRGVPIRLSADFSKETLQERSIQNDEKQGPTT